jgi:hypothetical protein
VAKGDSLKSKQKIAYTNANMLPPPDFRTTFKADRKAGIEAAAILETPAEARARLKRGGAKPAHYDPTPPLGAAAPKPPEKAPAA